MKINPHIFRGYDLRGVVDEDLNVEIVEHIGKAFGTYLKRAGIAKALISYDCRVTSKDYSEAMARGLNWAGTDVINIGMNLVGTFYWAQYHLDCKGGVFVTASHNPAQYNGFKFANDFSETLVSDGMQELRRMVQEDDVEEGEKAGEIKSVDIRKEYLEDISNRLPLSEKFKVVIDPSCSTAGAILPDFLRSVGCEVVEKNCEIDPSFPIGTPDPTESAVAERLRTEVLEAGADIGFSYDPDGDRIGIVSDKGEIIWNDVLVAIFAVDVLHTHPGEKIMFNTLCSKVVPETIVKYGGEPFMWRTGHSFLKKKNQEIKAAFIGELSGHFFFSADYYNHDDGFYSTMRLLSYLARTKKKMSEAISELPKYFSSPEIKVGCADDKKVDLISRVSDVLKKDYPDAEVIDDERAGDGVRLDMEDSMFIVRYSQNGPYLTIKFEANSQEKYNHLKVYIRELLHKYEEIDWSFGANVESLE
ncbi:MAG: Phosphoglucomutase/phosphomannomutase alpha/beta/alpha domain I [Candidatus Moranbacteria bacterium GW2011_GWE1_35_17]|nr:MAG: Phosphoglucomutase/phosphomannomutase alpha/beta/alpha domain I [Candidatus Moranbacteria bacterium GW2011_GWE1_35_17]KKP73312.1 MAG: Phosphoglucomutase/phosphomannomutase alpha/beta/alpha domain I [Candidatus Moranbacteria bacterium GW2011_GWE2_35_164]KKP80564.1 MAG: Phosphoglucomutase/phosphomannomutase alpha/beta/alpha domain I [Candidatus Moranbacteria bacterium GW2011_GWF1_35_5]KKP85093.1 MAG: Phosphoglucomutase/phosphomannomutase alpha/beta/alpha domain I [Candidatus Moranbacteria 